MIPELFAQGCHVAALSAANTDNAGESVAWALSMLEAGCDEMDVIILAGEMPPHHWTELQPLVRAAAQSVGIQFPETGQEIERYAALPLVLNLAGSSQEISAMTLFQLEQLCIAFGSFGSFGSFGETSGFRMLWDKYYCLLEQEDLYYRDKQALRAAHQTVRQEAISWISEHFPQHHCALLHG
ncbi:hypothetical protein [Halocynthiibacter styelae]|uniref:Uncharacterized protein n=1 Tax=Halocynthiibacter styelae TaxID=2761955 RepID=A0A8J7LNW3_9RHOB|nr:hypothetical protein [Paenihalocynthiibacter styelae]MBI1492716.1 hypothetical protein [Paenihalocynthiibacter styelae]